MTVKSLLIAIGALLVIDVFLGTAAVMPFVIGYAAGCIWKL